MDRVVLNHENTKAIARGDPSHASAHDASTSATARSGVIVGAWPEYEGAYEVTPTQSAQVLPTEHRSMAQNVVINPIPSNYGLITWDGSVLTVS